MLLVASAGLSQQKKGQRQIETSPNSVFHFVYGTVPLRQAWMEAQIRGYIWDHWHNRQKGRVVAAFATIEGDPIEHVFEIKPNKKGEWRIIYKIESTCCWLFRLAKPQWKTEKRTIQTIFTDLTRVEPTTSPVQWSTEITDTPSASEIQIEYIGNSEIRSPEKYRLYFKTTPASDSWLF